MAAYSLLADYGRSFVRPLVALAVSVPLFWWAYAAVLIPPTDPTKLARLPPRHLGLRDLQRRARSSAR